MESTSKLTYESLCEHSRGQRYGISINGYNYFLYLLATEMIKIIKNRPKNRINYIFYIKYGFNSK